MKNRSHRKAFTVLFACLLPAHAVFGAEAEKKPMWIDTIPPVVRIDPRETFQAKVFHAVLSANEQASIWVKVVKPGQARGSEGSMEIYRNPITVSEDGLTMVYFWAEDLFGNKSRPDSMRYVLDTRPPTLSVSPPGGTYRSIVTARLSANKPCRFILQRKAGDEGVATAESLTIKDSLSGSTASNNPFPSRYRAAPRPTIRSTFPRRLSRSPRSKSPCGFPSAAPLSGITRKTPMVGSPRNGKPPSPSIPSRRKFI
jgi:hypothetical protein